MGRKSDGIISMTFGDLERSDQGHLPKIMVSVRDSTTVTNLLLITNRNWKVADLMEYVAIRKL